ncbi:MAG: DUF4268 domain-containing protein [Salinibacter sp.]
MEKVNLREVWDTEDRAFTPWLAQPENIELLGDTLGIDLEVQDQETSVGPFQADLLCHDTVTNDWVLIENQLERTDHTHLGQLLTYAAGLDAVTVIWVARHFNDEHRAALDWLNDITEETINFFGLEIELWRIGNSPVAPKFNVICQPNDWTKTVSEAKRGSGSLSETKRAQLEFWQAFRAFVDEQGSFVKPTKAYAQQWMDLAIGRSGFGLSAVASAINSETEDYDGGEIRAEVVIRDKHSKDYFRLLQQERDQIEEELGEVLTWHNPEKARMCRIYLRKSTDIFDRDQWQDHHRWLLEKLEALHNVFSPRIKVLSLTNENPER